MYTSITLAAYAAVSLSVVLALLYRFSVSTYDKWERAGVPYMKPVVPLFGNFLGVVSGADHQVDFFRHAYYQLAGHKYGGLFLMRTPYLMIRDPKTVHDVLVRDFAHFQNRGIYSDFALNPMMDNLFFMENPRWKTIRSKLTPAFTSGKLRTMHDQIKECSDELMRNVRRLVADNGQCEVEARDLMANYTTDVVGTCAFGLRLNSIGDEHSEFREHGKSMFEPSIRFVFRELCLMISPVLLKVIKIRDFPGAALEFFHRAFHETIAYREKNCIVRNDIVDHLMQARKDLVFDENVPKEQSQIVANAFILFIGGFETTSSTLSFCLYELALKKHIQDKVRAEIKSNVAKYGKINNEFLMSLVYLEMVIAETLRKHPVLFALFRQATETYQVPNDSLIIEKGQKLIIPMHSLHYDTRYFPNPDVFDPERFTPEEIAKRPKCCYLPFGDGPRMCIAKRFGEMNMKLALTEILLKFKVEPCEKTQVPMKYAKKAFTVIPENGMWLRFVPISD